MSELTNARNDRNDFRWRLLSTVSAAALLASVCAAPQAVAAENDSPPFWIELGGMLSQDQGNQDAFLPPFALTEPRPPYAVVSPTEFEKPSASSWDGTAKIAYESSGTGWVFSVDVVYGKSTKNKYLNQQTAQLTAIGFGYDAYQDLSARSSGSHAIVDFQAGKDVGLGLFGSGVRSAIDLGVRYAQFNSRSRAAIQSQPTNVATAYAPFHRFYGTFIAARKFTGVGPSLSWDASAGLIGNPSAGHITVDWGLNGAVLFGRQRTQIHYHTSNTIHLIIGTYHNYVFNVHYQVSQHSASPDRSKQVVVPNFGGFAGISWRYPNAKVSFGYRADFFFGAMDGGIGMAHRENVGFYGPFASISIGIGG
jgi:iron complex outermembrane recepter protein